MPELSLGEKAPEIALASASGDMYRLSEDQQQRPGWRFIVYFRGSW
ncbi:hypothetical protein [Salibacterium aidingense]|nr:hypothetical protein [Salibacterium aidingense]